MIRSRHELKYLVTEAQAVAIAACIRPLMRPDHHSAAGVYPLVSLYLDSPDLRLCRESIEGVVTRFKLRIRSYSDEPNAPCFFEIKRRINRVIVKSRARTPRALVAAILADGADAVDIGGDQQRNLEQFLYYQRLVQAAPKLRVRYLRQAFEIRDGNDVRLTFDRRLSFSTTLMPNVSLDGSGWMSVPHCGVVFEIKFTNQYPTWLTRLVQQFGLVQQSMSKYARSVQTACRLRFCAPYVVRRDDHGAVMALS